MAIPMVPPRDRVEDMMPLATAMSSGGTESCPTARRVKSVMPSPVPIRTGNPQTSALVWAPVVDMHAKKAMKARKANTVIQRTFFVRVQYSPAIMLAGITTKKITPTFRPTTRVSKVYSTLI